VFPINPMGFPVRGVLPPGMQHLPAPRMLPPGMLPPGMLPPGMLPPGMMPLMPPNMAKDKNKERREEESETGIFYFKHFTLNAFV